MQIENGKIYLLTSFINKIIIISDPEKIFKNIFDYQYIQIYYIRFDLEEENIIYFKTTTFTSFKMLQNDISIINEISSKIVLKFNLLDFENGYEEIKIKNIGIELDDKEIKIIKTNKKVIFIVYEIKYIEYEYFPQKIYLDDESNSFPYQLQFFVYKGFMTEVNLFIKNNFGLSYEFLYFSLNNNFPNEIGITYKPGKILKVKNFQSFNCQTRKRVIFINIPPQGNEDLGYDTSFLYIYLCNENENKLYGKFCLNSIEIKKKENYKFNLLVKILISDIYSDFGNYIEKNLPIKELKKNIFLLIK